MIKITALTYSNRKGVTQVKVMKVSGHKNMVTFQRFVEMFKNEAVDDI